MTFEEIALLRKHAFEEGFKKGRKYENERILLLIDEKIEKKPRLLFSLLKRYNERFGRPPENDEELCFIIWEFLRELEK